jgi:hypothetical protein
MICYQLKNRLEHLQLAGYDKDEGYLWFAPKTETGWDKVELADDEFEELSN